MSKVFRNEDFKTLTFSDEDWGLTPEEVKEKIEQAGYREISPWPVFKEGKR